jgi:hypothetical protein
MHIAALYILADFAVRTVPCNATRSLQRLRCCSKRKADRSLCQLASSCRASSTARSSASRRPATALVSSILLHGTDRRPPLDPGNQLFFIRQLEDVPKRFSDVLVCCSTSPTGAATLSLRQLFPETTVCAWKRAFRMRWNEAQEHVCQWRACGR